MTLQEVMTQLEAAGSDRVRTHNKRRGASDNQFGVKLGDIRKLAKKIKTNRALAFELWQTQNLDARFLAVLLIKPKTLSSQELDNFVRSIQFDRVADWVNAYLVKHHPDKEQLRQTWMTESNPMAARAGWNLTAERVAKDPQDLDLKALLDRIEAEMANADPLVQWTMNMCLVETGIHSPEHRERALSIGETLGIYSDYPVTKGCTSPFAPIWIKEMVRRMDQ